MIVYADRAEWLRPAERLAEIRRAVDALAATARPQHDAAVAALIDFGVLEAAVADALAPRADDTTPTIDALGRCSVAFGRVLAASWAEQATTPAVAALSEALAALDGDAMPARVRGTVPEGYAYYALTPEMYLDAANRFAAARPPGRALVVGIRGIGTGLSGVVAAALAAHGWSVARCTVRPRGHPFARVVEVGPRLARAFATAGECLVVDEGPGLSGSSFAAAAASLGRAGTPDERITFVPSWDADGSTFVSADAAAAWRRHRRVVADFDATWIATGRLRNAIGIDGAWRDLSAGSWRDVVYAATPASGDVRGSCTTRPAVHPRHERRKYLVEDTTGARTFVKFAGLGRYGSSKMARAAALAEAEFAPPVACVTAGFLVRPFVAGTPVVATSTDDRAVATAARYLAFIRRTFALDASPSIERVAEMVTTNVGEGLGTEWIGRAESILRAASPAVRDAPAVAIDGRMLAHEWLRGPDGRLLKTDALDHHADHFFPGCKDIAWDVASAIEELALDEGAATALVARYATAAHDPSITRRLPFHRVAYLGYRLGYATLAATTLEPSSDREAFAALASEYRARLGHVLTFGGGPHRTSTRPAPHPAISTARTASGYFGPRRLRPRR